MPETRLDRRPASRGELFPRSPSSTKGSGPRRPSPRCPGEGTPKSDAALGACRVVREKIAYPAGSAVVPLDQRAAKVAIHLLEPQGPDSFVAWGFFDAIFEQKEFGEDYVVEKLAREMLAKDPRLAAEFEAKLAADPKFARSPEARLAFFYDRSPWRDPKMGLYPVGRLGSLSGIPIAR